MKIPSIVLSGLIAMQSFTLQAATQNYQTKNRLTEYLDGQRSYRTQWNHYSFLVEVIGDSCGTKAESWKTGRPFVTAINGERYSVRLHNPLPVRVAVNLTVDGLNSISGKPAGISDGDMWLIEPNSFITIRGWQVSEKDARRFFFTDKPKSYAEWRGEKLNKDLSVNCGVIGAAYFWNKAELQTYFDQNPRYVYRQHQNCNSCKGLGLRMDDLAAKDESPSAGDYFQKEAVRDSRRKADKPQEAGTGMGERESHATQLVEFHHDEGMYKASQAVVIYYDFAPTTIPNPFPNLSFAPEMED